MRCCPFAPVVVFPTLLLISAGSSQISDDGNKTGLRWALRELKRQRCPTGGDHERLHVSRQRRTARSQCLSGQIMSPPGCRAGDPGCSCMCKPGSFLQYGQRCRLCQKCKYGQVVVKNCTASTDTECSCKAGRYKSCNFRGVNCNDFSCNICTLCMAQNKTTRTNCSATEDAVCGNCLSGYNLSANHECLPLPPPTTQNPEIELHIPAAPVFKWEYALCIVCSLLLLGTLLTCYKRRRTKKPPAAGSFLSLPQPGLPMLRRTALSHIPPLQSRQLYAIIDVVPVRRWKEFVRSLGLRDGEIEAVELEHRQLREQQYEMLKGWLQKQGATMDALFAALEEMELGGCAQELRQLLQPNNSQLSP